MSRYNRMPRPIAVMGTRAAFMHLCHHSGVDPNSNDVFYHVSDYQQACSQNFMRLMEIQGAKDTIDYNTIKSLVMRRIQNEAVANPSQHELS